MHGRQPAAGWSPAGFKPTWRRASALPAAALKGCDTILKTTSGGCFHDHSRSTPSGPHASHDAMTELDTLDVRTRRQWRAWLEKHHASSPGVWLLFYKNHTGVKSIPYEDSLREALCFGWIDSLIKRVDEDRYARK